MNLANNFARWCSVLIRPPKSQLARPSASLAVAIVLILAVAIASMFFGDVAASAWARRLPQWFVDVFECITDFGLGGWFLFPLAFLLLCLASMQSAKLPYMTQGVLAALTARFGFLFIAIGGTGLIGTLVKRIIGRARPFVGGHDDPFLYVPFVWRPEYASLPSGHATTAMAAAVAFGAIWPRLRWVMWPYALIIMFSRVVVLAHHPSDVIAGALLGAIGAMLVRRWFAARHLVFSPMDLRSFPGPSSRRVRAAIGQAVFGR